MREGEEYQIPRRITKTTRDQIPQQNKKQQGKRGEVRQPPAQALIVPSLAVIKIKIVEIDNLAIEKDKGQGFGRRNRVLHSTKDRVRLETRYTHARARERDGSGKSAESSGDNEVH